MTLILAGGVILCMHRGIRALVRSRPHRLRTSVVEAARRDPCFRQAPSRAVLLEFLLEPDRQHLDFFPLRARLPRLLIGVADRILGDVEPRRALENALERCTRVLEEGRKVWIHRSSADGARSPENQKEEDPTHMHQLLFVLVILITSLYRLHLILWGRPPRAISRRRLGRLRRSWLPFCLLIPTPRNFPPEVPLAHEESAPQRVSWGDTEEALLQWIHKGSPGSEERLIEVLLGPSPSKVAPGEDNRGNKR